jgi:hypothetical protein
LLRYALIIFLPALYIFLIYADGLFAFADFVQIFRHLLLLGLYRKIKVVVGLLQFFLLALESVLLQQFRLGNPSYKHIRLFV